MWNERERVYQNKWVIVAGGMLRAGSVVFKLGCVPLLFSESSPCMFKTDF